MAIHEKTCQIFQILLERKIGFQLRAIQQGQQPTSFKPMPIVGQGVEEIRVKVGDAYRVFYVAKFPEAIYVLHAFQKKPQNQMFKQVNYATTI